MLRFSPLVLLAACGSPGIVPAGELAVDSRCTATFDRVDCAHETFVAQLKEAREVHWQVPNRTAPASGWPVVLMFQGSGFSAEHNWAARQDDKYGAIHQALLVKRLLDSGFAVITPEARENGSLYWDTNIWPWASDWEHSGDAALMTVIFDELGKGTFGPCDSTRLFATGISSGGYMTSRMALSYAGKFRALAIASASWATCGGFWCAMPEVLPDQHPPTLFLHGKKDALVGYGTMTDYESLLRKNGYQTSIVASETLGHEWLPEAPDAATNWFTERL